jgi:hypothetical protein
MPIVITADYKTGGNENLSSWFVLPAGGDNDLQKFQK